jgi:hypothetical protein
MARDSNGESPTQMAQRILREAHAAAEAAGLDEPLPGADKGDDRDRDRAKASAGGPVVDTAGANMVLALLRRKVDLERAMNAGRIRE